MFVAHISYLYNIIGISTMAASRPLTLLLLAVLVMHAASLYTSSKFEDEGFNVKDGKFTEPPTYGLTINTATVCNKVNLAS